MGASLQGPAPPHSSSILASSECPRDANHPNPPGILDPLLHELLLLEDFPASIWPTSPLAKDKLTTHPNTGLSDLSSGDANASLPASYASLAGVLTPECMDADKALGAKLGTPLLSWLLLSPLTINQKDSLLTTFVSFIGMADTFVNLLEIVCFRNSVMTSLLALGSCPWKSQQT